jgi:cytochrome c oxidase subunit II
MEWLRTLMLPVNQGSDFATEVDFIYMTLFWGSVFFFVGIVGAAAYFSWRYRYKPGRATPHQTHNTTLEIIWTVIPTMIIVVIFFWGVNGYMKFAVAPGEAMEVQVVGKQWLWTFEYPDGTRSVNEMHVPVNKNIRLVMSSEDVLHDFYVPDMRIKRDIIPGRYTQIWFRANDKGLGEHVTTCAEYCGKGHSDMRAKLFVDTQADYDKWMATGGTEWEDYKTHMQDWGKIQWDRKGCSTCHSLDGTASKGPTWKGMWGSMVKLSDGKSVLVDEAYVRESMMLPQAKIVAGFDPVMPTFQGLLRENEINGLIALMKSLK